MQNTIKVKNSRETSKLQISHPNDKKLNTAKSFKYLRAFVLDGGSKPEIFSRIAQSTAAITKLKPVWSDNNISLGSKVALVRSLAISMFLYARRSWTLTAKLQK